MHAGTISKRIVADRVSWIQRMLTTIRGLPLGDQKEFFDDPRNVAAAESYLRRALEAVLDLGRHILARGLGESVTEYKDVARRLREKGVLSQTGAQLLINIVGYRNRMVHFYHEVTPEELHLICRDHLAEVEQVVQDFLVWLRTNPQRINEGI